eukprot:6379970-Amphidinium_carterae.2
MTRAGAVPRNILASSKPKLLKTNTESLCHASATSYDATPCQVRREVHPSSQAMLPSRRKMYKERFEQGSLLQNSCST